METISYDALVELITKEVLKVISAQNAAGGSGNTDARPLALVIGCAKDLPAYAAENYRFAELDAYTGDIEPYDCVWISALTCTQLADCALGRDASAAPCSVTQALLHGKKVMLMEAGLPHRPFSATANRKFYAMLEGYVNTLRSFGVELVRAQWYGKNLNKDAIEDNSVDKVITEKLAKSRCEKAQNGTVSLKKGTVITPSAKDIFNHSQVTVQFVD